MKFVNQIILEMKHLLKSKFILISAILILLVSVGMQIFTLVQPEQDYYYDPYMEEFEVDGVTISTKNPYYHEIRNIYDFTQNMGMYLTEANAIKDAEKLADDTLDFYIKYTSSIESYDDFRSNPIWNSSQNVYELFLLENEVSEEFFVETSEGYFPMYLDSMLAISVSEMTATEKATRIDEINESFETLDKIIIDGDFSAYIDYMIADYNKQIADYQLQIAELEQTIIDDPSQEFYLGPQIDDYNRNIQRINESDIPALEYRREHNLIPGEDIWQNRALDSKVGNESTLSYYSDPMTLDEFNMDPYYAERYGTYDEYLKEIEKIVSEAQNNILIAERSLEADKPDMSFEPEGSRTLLHANLGITFVVAIFAILVGGWGIASEFQSGTIRLLMIRPRTRMKMIFSKYLAGLKLSYIIYFVTFILAFVIIGAINGFGDYFNPNFTVNGESSFLIDLILNLLVSSITIIFGYSFAFAGSMIFKNIAVAIIIPIVCILGSAIAVPILAFNYMGMPNKWLALTPLPYFNLSEFFVASSTVNNMIDRGYDLNITIGIAMLLVLSIGSMVFATIKFKAQDITN